MTLLEIFYIYAPIYLVRNILTFINFLRKKKKGEMAQVTEVTAEMAIETVKSNKGWMLIFTFIEIPWGIIGFFTPLGWIFVAIGVNNIIRMWISAKAPREKASGLFTMNSIIQISLIGYLVWEICGDLL